MFTYKLFANNEKNTVCVHTDGYNAYSKLEFLVVSQAIREYINEA